VLSALGDVEDQLVEALVVELRQTEILTGVG
jgi:hypothetical protein